MPLQPESKYPPRRSYVLKMRRDARPDLLAGRIENLVTGQQLEFASARELLDALARDIAPGAGDPPTGEEP